MGKFISLAYAKEMINRFKNEQENILIPLHQNKEILPLSETLEKDQLEILLKLPGCKKIRIYYGMDHYLKIHSILVAVDKENQDIIIQSENLYQEEEDILNDNIRCPPYCNSSPLTR
jgi:hypothetical protein